MDLSIVCSKIILSYICFRCFYKLIYITLRIKEQLKSQTKQRSTELNYSQRITYSQKYTQQ